jgi:dolichyl-phosphate-mannose-protein mannosyltransferase
MKKPTGGIRINRLDLTTRNAWLLGFALVFGLAIRLWIAYRITGYDVDVNTFKAWAGMLASGGLSHFYQEGVFSDYPPGYMYILYIVGVLRSVFSIPFESPWFTLLLKLPAIAADTMIAALLYRWSKEHLRQGVAIVIALSFWLSPAILINSAAWGQVDSFFMLWILISLRQLEKGKLEKAAALYAVAILVKPQALLLGPIFLVALVKRRSWPVFGRSGLYGLLVLALLSFPFLIYKGPFYLFELYFGTLASYSYASLNAYNLMALFGGNFVSTSSALALGTYKQWGLILLVLVYAYAVWLLWRSRREEGAYSLIALFLFAAVFIVSTKMHERYLFYALPLALLCFLYIQKRWLLYIYAALSVTSFVNVLHVLVQSTRKLYHIPPTNGILVGISMANVILLGIIAVYVWRQLRIRLHRDSALLSGIVIVYSCLALWNLGSMQAPENGWKPEAAGEAVVVDLGEVRLIDRFNSFAGIGDGRLKLEWSEDGQHWSGELPLDIDVFKIYSWQETFIKERARYIRLQVEQSGFVLLEAAIFAEGSSEPLPVIVQHTSALAEAGSELFDEQHLAPAHRSFMNGMYFDEIYHARTAYEHIHQMEPYETTHPPLGKVLISLGIYGFGMNPFGWRMIGTMVGIAMIPIMYMLANALFRNTRYALIAALLFALDGMHFAQTRIATIDVYGVFFILLMFYYMIRYMETDTYDQPLRKAFLPLASAGLCFGMGAASKWIVFYAGAGLAVLFAIKLYWDFATYRDAKRAIQSRHRMEEENRERLERIIARFPRSTAASIGWCLIWFVAVPVLIYVASYIPFMMVPGSGHSLADVWSYQKHMFSYHSQLTATHPFSSPWWQWPSMTKPIWYYGATSLPVERVSSIAAIGNPLIWWAGIAAIVALAVEWLRSRIRAAGYILLAFLCQYVPWMFVSRATFIYHYFAMVPFSILAILYFCKKWRENGSLSSKGLAAYLIAAGAVFLLFFPILSGLEVSRWYAETFIRWFDSWILF